MSQSQRRIQLTAAESCTNFKITNCKKKPAPRSAMELQERPEARARALGSREGQGQQGSVSRGLQGSEMSLYITNLATIFQLNVENAKQHLLLIVYAKVLQRTDCVQAGVRGHAGASGQFIQLFPALFLFEWKYLPQSPYSCMTFISQLSEEYRGIQRVFSVHCSLAQEVLNPRSLMHISIRYRL